MAHSILGSVPFVVGLDLEAVLALGDLVDSFEKHSVPMISY